MRLGFLLSYLVGRVGYNILFSLILSRPRHKSDEGDHVTINVHARYEEGVFGVSVIDTVLYGNG